ncbi:hypothetical protein K438DRAFT_1836517 [Mycena galopus ATCC 62051]|nr:hypothetical protein K438DRAFT_1836517 [Mycena galopus ATCC 62051]
MAGTDPVQRGRALRPVAWASILRPCPVLTSPSFPRVLTTCQESAMCACRCPTRAHLRELRGRPQSGAPYQAYDCPPCPSGMPLRRLSTELKLLFYPIGVAFTHSLFSHITHLELLDPIEGEKWEQWQGLALIPNLTHLAFFMEVFVPLIQGALAACSALRVLVCLYIIHPPEVSEGFASLAQDPRFVILRAPNFVEDWEIGARGGEDFWVRAERLIAQRNSGEVNRETFVLVEEEDEEEEEEEEDMF